MSSKYIVCLVVNTIFGNKRIYKHFNTAREVSDFLISKLDDTCLINAFVYENIEEV